MPMRRAKQGDRVRCIKGHVDKEVLETGREYIIAVVFDRELSLGLNTKIMFDIPQYVLINPTCSYPYLWDDNRFTEPLNNPED